MTLTLAVDLGGTTIRAAAVSDTGEVVHRLRKPTPTTERPDLLVSMVEQVRDEVEDTVEVAVFGFPGVVDHREGRLTMAPNIAPSWLPYLNADWLGQATGLDAYLANDADLATVGEWAWGAGAEFDDVAYVTISTGIGAGMVVRDRLVRGRYSGGELGHTVVDYRAASQGQEGTVEGLGAGRALARAAAARGLPSGAELVDLVNADNPDAVAVWHDAIDVAAYGIVNLCWLVAPEVVVVGGGVGRNDAHVLPVIKQRLVESGPKTGREIAVVTASLGDDAGLVGAAAWTSVIGDGR